jgi:hypothetical protein
MPTAHSDAISLASDIISTSEIKREREKKERKKFFYGKKKVLQKKENNHNDVFYRFFVIASRLSNINII